MTTPAIERHEIRQREGYYLAYRDGVLVSKRYPTASVWKVDHSRPESVSTVKLPDGYRPPTSWTHSYVFEPLYLDVRHKASFSYPPEGGQDWEVKYYLSLVQFGAYPRINYDQNLVDRAINGALEKLAANKINLGVMFGERKQTARLFAETITKIAKQIRQFKKGNQADWRSVRRNQRGYLPHEYDLAKSKIPSRWLELQYGWKPLLSDVYGAAEALASREDKDDRYHITVTKMVGDKIIRKFVRSFDTYGYYLEWKDRTDLGASVSLTYDMDNSFVRSLASVGAFNPLEIIWELVPYSFVVDWALPIGEWLGLQTADLGWKFRGGSISRMRKEFSVPNALVKSFIGNPAWATTQVEGLDTLRRQAWGFDRTVLHSSPRPRIYTKNPLSLGHVANATALLATALQGVKPAIRR